MVALVLVLEGDLVSGADSCGQVDRHLRAGEPLLGRQVPADPQQDQGADGDMQWVRLSPKDEDSGFKYILIGLNNGQLSGMETGAPARAPAARVTTSRW